VAQERFVFGTFEVSTYRRDVRCAGRVVEISARAFDLLIALLRRSGQLVSKAELLCDVWPGMTVEPNNLEVCVSALRKIFESGGFASGPIVTVRGRGYCFVEPVRALQDAEDLHPATAVTAQPPAPRKSNQPLYRQLTTFVGRADDQVLIRDRLTGRRFVTLIGPGGVGKTRLAREIGVDMSGDMADGVVFADFAAATTLQSVLEILSEQLQIGPNGQLDASACATSIGDKNVLLILDTCDRVFEIVGMLVGYLIGHCSRLLILTTSRRRLGVPGEVIVEVKPLATPEPTIAIGASEALKSPAVALFVDRATTTVASFALDESNVADIVALCSMLDGLPLAIELAVPLLKVLTPTALVQCVERRPQVLNDPNRAIPARHRTLRALVDWSFDSLSAEEKILFRRLAIFSGPIPLAMVREILFENEVDRDDVLIMMLALAEKSLLGVELDRSETHFRMLRVVRAHGLAKLAEAGEQEIYRRFATCVAKRLEEAGQSWQRVASKTWIETHIGLLGDLGTALTWAFGPDGDRRIGVALAGAGHALRQDTLQTKDQSLWIQRALEATAAERRLDPEALAKLKVWPSGDPGRNR
jgi:predicted ATPase/DNA-binding winged helix-turn-helix (wHTH) protein